MSCLLFLIGLIGQGIGGLLLFVMYEEEGFCQGFGYVYWCIDFDVFGVIVDVLL